VGWRCSLCNARKWELFRRASAPIGPRNESTCSATLAKLKCRRFQPSVFSSAPPHYRGAYYFSRPIVQEGDLFAAPSPPQVSCGLCGFSSGCAEWLKPIACRGRTIYLRLHDHSTTTAATVCIIWIRFYPFG
jgi:hypothetical protein